MFSFCSETKSKTRNNPLPVLAASFISLYLSLYRITRPVRKFPKKKIPEAIENQTTVIYYYHNYKQHSDSPRLTRCTHTTEQQSRSHPAASASQKKKCKQKKNLTSARIDRTKLPVMHCATTTAFYYKNNSSLCHISTVEEHFPQSDDLLPCRWRELECLYEGVKIGNTGWSTCTEKLATLPNY